MSTFSIQHPLDQPTGRSRLLRDLESGLENDDFERLRIIVAYAKVAPLQKIRRALEVWTEAGKSIEVIYGIDQQGTSLEALTLSLEIFDSVRIVHQEERSHTFHPKMYLFQGGNLSKMYVGSNNLTVGGTETNFECGITVDLQSPEDQVLIEELEEMWSETHSHAREVTDEFLTELQGADLVVSEEEMRERTTEERPRESEQRSASHFPQTSTQPASSFPQQEANATEDASAPGKVTAASSLEWRKRNLKRRDSQRPGEGTKASGLLTLVQDYFRDDSGDIIDQTTYFREEVFGDLEWWEEDDKEVTEAEFKVWMEDSFWGTYNLRISHKLEWEADQDNYTTAIHWGELNQVLRQEVDIRGYNLYLYETDVVDRWEIQLIPLD